MESAFAVCSGFLGFLKELIPIVDDELPGSSVLSDLFGGF